MLSSLCVMVRVVNVVIYVTSVVVEYCCVEFGVLFGFKCVDTTGIDVCFFICS